MWDPRNREEIAGNTSTKLMKIAKDIFSLDLSILPYFSDLVCTDREECKVHAGTVIYIIIDTLNYMT